MQRGGERSRRPHLFYHPGARGGGGLRSHPPGPLEGRRWLCPPPSAPAAADAPPPARLPRLRHIFSTIEQWTMTKTKFEVMNICNAVDIPVGPILSMKEIAEEPSLRKTGTVVEVDHPKRGKYLTVGNPVKMSD